MSSYATQCSRFRNINLGMTRELPSSPDDQKSTATFQPDCFFVRFPQSVIRMFELEGLDHVALGVSDVEEIADWYVEVLGFERLYDGMWGSVPVFIGRGKTALALFPVAGEGPKASVARGATGMLHLALRADRENFAAAQRDLTSRGITFDFHDHGISHSIYFSDPEENKLEITTYDLGGPA